MSSLRNEAERCWVPPGGESVPTPPPPHLAVTIAYLRLGELLLTTSSLH